ncbi:putative pectinesterase inhibitor domain-containing protein [Arabidopsis thaliana]
MGLNVKSCFLFANIVFFLVFVVSASARFSTEVTKSEINSICTHTDVDASLCFEFLNSSPQIAALDFYGLTKYLITYESRKFSDMLKQFQSLVNSTTDPSAKGSYHVCVGTFDKGTGCFDDAFRHLASKDYITLEWSVECTFDMAAGCEDELSTFKPNPQLFKDISIVKNLSIMGLVIVKQFLRK